MARQRFIHPDVWSDPTVARLEPAAMLLFIGCFSNADDEGRLLGDPAILKATIFPYQPLSVRQIKRLRDSVVAASSIELYVVEGIEYLAFRKWGEYQKPKYPKPSRFPPPPGTAAGEIPETIPENDSGTVPPVNSEMNGETVPPLDRVGFGLGRTPPTPPAGGRRSRADTTPEPVRAEFACPHCPSLSFRSRADLADHVEAMHAPAVPLAEAAAAIERMKGAA